MAIKKILVPYNFRPEDNRSITFVEQAFSHHAAVDITLFNAFTPVPELKTSGSTVMDRVKGNLTYLEQRQSELGEELEQVRKTIVEKGFEDHRVHTLFKARKLDVAGEIIAAARDGLMDMVVLSRKHGKVTGFFTGSVYQKVVQALNRVTVCIVS
jgi:nucleotide-binding universal stress UspA family protein